MDQPVASKRTVGFENRPWSSGMQKATEALAVRQKAEDMVAMGSRWTHTGDLVGTHNVDLDLVR